MKDAGFLVIYLLVIFGLAALALKLGEVADRLLKIKGSTLWFFVILGLIFSLSGWEQYANGKISIWDALGVSLLLGGLPIIVSFAFVLHELPAAIFAAGSFVVRKLFRKSE